MLNTQEEDKMENSMEAENIKMQIVSLKEELEKHYKELGAMYFEKNCNNVQEEDKELFFLIEKKRGEIQKLQNQINIINGVIVCNKCGQKVSEISIFCPECGNIMRQVQKSVPSGYMVCSHCNGTVKKGTKYCDLCGNKIESDDTGDKAEIKMTRCKQCGQVLEPGEQFCFNCGTRIESINILQEHLKVSQPQMIKEKSSNNSGQMMVSRLLCHNCGKEIEEDSLFCIYCGTRVK